MKKTGKLFLTLSFLYAILILALGTWWLYLIVQFGEKISGLTGEDGQRVLRMVKWEGGTFLTLLFLLSASLLFLYWKDQKKTKGLQAFFASMTHELKTPLASIRLQTEVLNEELEEHDLSEREQVLMGRLIEDTNKLETQMDKILQLSRLEGGGNFTLAPINLKEQWQSSLKRWSHDLKIEDDIPSDLILIGDEFALNLIFRNLFENTKQHSKGKTAVFKASGDQQSITFSYSDTGVFDGDTNKLGQLFYKYNSKKGSGIGLYLIRKLTEQMKGTVSFQTSGQMTYLFSFPRGDEHE